MATPELEKVERALREARHLQEQQRGRLDRPLELIEGQQVWKGPDARAHAEALRGQRSRLQGALARIVEDLEGRARVLRHNQP